MAPHWTCRWLLAGLWLPATGGRAATVSLEGPLGLELDGIGGVSAGTGPRLLVDYEEPTRSNVLDYLFLPGFGANLQVLKVEIGGTGDSTQGTEASHEPERGALEPKAGYELWMASEAKRRNPDIVIYGLAWTFPGWVGSAPEGFAAAAARYIVDWVQVAAEEGVRVDLLGWHNEKTWKSEWVLGLRSELDRRGYASVKLVVGDCGPGQGYQTPDMLARLQQNADLNAAAHAVGFHYPLSILPAEKNRSLYEGLAAMGKRVWASEDYSTYSDTAGGRCLAKLLNRNFIDGNVTSTLVWDLIWSAYDGLACAGDGLLWAAEPWTGRFGVPLTVWVTAHTTQFTRRGWRYLGRPGSGYLPGGQEGKFGGSYVTLVSSERLEDVTLIAETIDVEGSSCSYGNDGWKDVVAKGDQDFRFCFARGVCAAGHRSLAARRSEASSDPFQEAPDVALDADCCFRARLRPNSVYSFSSLRTARRGERPGATVVPPEGASSGCGFFNESIAAPFPLPYSTTFGDGLFRDFPRYLMDLNGVFRVRNGSLRQTMLELPVAWIGTITAPVTVLGSKDWTDYSVSTTAMLPSGAPSSAFVSVLARVGNGFSFSPMGGYALRLSAAGSWHLLVGNGTNFSSLASGHHAASPLGAWRQLRLSLAGHIISAALDGQELCQVRDSTWASGLAGIGSSIHPASFQKLAVEPRGSPGLHTGVGALLESESTSLVV